MAKIDALPDALLDPPADLLGSLNDEDGVLFVCNVGDADSVVFLLPADHLGVRRILIVDAGRTGKTESLIDTIAAAGIGFPATDDPGSIPIVVATHPHADHIRGLAGVLTRYKNRITEFWDSGYYHPSAGFTNLMKTVEDNPNIVYAQPTAGYRRFMSTAALTVLAPAVTLRNKYDSYGVAINDASIVLAVEFPAISVTEQGGQRTYTPSRGKKRFVLGADAQTLSWSHVLTDFPELMPSSSAAAKAIKAATKYRDLMSAHVLKVAHHGSKRGINFELLERVAPRYVLVSSGNDSSQYSFPHKITQTLAREARQPIENDPAGASYRPDHELGIFYTADMTQNGAGAQEAGTIAIVAGPSRALEVWRLQDGANDDITISHLANARRWIGAVAPRRTKRT